MEDIKNTPWKVSEEFKTVVLNSKGEMVADCSIFSELRSEEENIQNAKIIALVPEMLGLLTFIVERDIFQEDYNKAMEIVQDFLKKITS